MTISLKTNLVEEEFSHAEFLDILMSFMMARRSLRVHYSQGFLPTLIIAEPFLHNVPAGSFVNFCETSTSKLSCSLIEVSLRKLTHILP